MSDVWSKAEALRDALKSLKNVCPKDGHHGPFDWHKGQCPTHSAAWAAVREADEAYRAAIKQVEESEGALTTTPLGGRVGSGLARWMVTELWVICCQCSARATDQTLGPVTGPKRVWVQVTMEWMASGWTGTDKGPLCPTCAAVRRELEDEEDQDEGTDLEVSG